MAHGTPKTQRDTGRTQPQIAPHGQRIAARSHAVRLALCFSGLKTALRLPGVVLLSAGLLLMTLHLWCSKRKAPQAAPAVTAVPRATTNPGAPAACDQAAARRILKDDHAEPALAPAAPSADSPAPVPAHDRLTRWSPEVFAAIEWRRFEAVVEALFAQAGFETRAQTHGADGGVDIWLHSRHAGGAPVGMVQCKHWQGKPVGVQQMCEFLGVLAHHGFKRGTCATTSCFTPPARWPLPAPTASTRRMPMRCCSSSPPARPRCPPTGLVPVFLRFCRQLSPRQGAA